MTENSEPKIGGILLAAGGSSRFGSPKQLVEFDGKTLIRRAAKTLVDSKCYPIVVVLGAEIERSTAELVDLDLNACINKTWQAGMSTSIVAGLKFLLDREPNLDAVVITLCDQPFVRSDDLDKLIEAFRITRSPIVASLYDQTTGVPALFSKLIFDDLLALKGDKGAKGLINNSGQVTTVALSAAVLDIDEQTDIEMLWQGKK